MIEFTVSRELAEKLGALPPRSATRDHPMRVSTVRLMDRARALVPEDAWELALTLVWEGTRPPEFPGNHRKEFDS